MTEQVNVKVHKQELCSLQPLFGNRERIPVIIVDVKMFCADEYILKKVTDV